MKAYLRSLADEFGESTNAIRLELNHLEEAGLLCSELERNKKIYQANTSHPLFNEIRSLVLKHSGITQIIDEVVIKTGDIDSIWIQGDFSMGKNSNIIDMVVVGNKINKKYFTSLIKKTEELTKREIHYIIIPIEKENDFFSNSEKKFLAWKK